MPELMEVVVANGQPLPEPELPYYVFAKEGLYLHKKTEIGTVLVKTNSIPYTVASIGDDKNGVFYWEGNPLPGEIVGQATSFFRRIYQKHGTEAEVIIVKHKDTGAYRLFVPYQRTSGGGVKSIFDPMHIDKNYMVVGTLHSHCMMSAFHSGTDTNDANDMDGVHFTIGQVLNSVPQIVAMVSMNKQQFHYRNPADIADLNFNGFTAPEWWDNYVFPKEAPKTKPAGMKTTTDAQWNEFLGVTVGPSKTSTWQGNGGGWRRDGYVPQPIKTIPHPSRDWDYDPDYGVSVHKPIVPTVTPITTESARFNSQPHISRREEKRLRKQAQREAAKNARRQLAAVVESDDDAAEWAMITRALDKAEETGVFHASDWFDFNATELDTPVHWRTFFLGRLRDLASVLDTLGMTVEYKARMKSTPLAVGQTSMAEYTGV